MLVVRELGQGNFAPEIGGEEGVCFCDLLKFGQLKCIVTINNLKKWYIQQRELLSRSYPLWPLIPLPVYIHPVHQRVGAGA